ncbi:MAG TPA: serine--tRNA ligase [Acidimicrobiia bacterium]|nr:serine--tRNA ligase [Acidimicrobiia bacterium]
MIDLRRLRDDPDYRVGVERKRAAAGLIDQVLELDAEARAQRRTVEDLRSSQKAVSKRIGRGADEPSARREAAALKERLHQAEEELGVLDRNLRVLALQVPNPADPTVPDGGEEDAVVLRTVGVPGPEPRLDHAAFAAAMGFVETRHAVEASGSRFASLLGEAVLLELALVAWTLGRLREEGFTPVVPPVLVREAAMEEAGFFPTDRNQVYEVDGGELFLVGTSEVPLSTLHRGERLTEDDLPARYVGASACFRREAGTHGKDTRGIFRVHQFDKVEMFVFADPADSDAEFDRLVAVQESLIGGLGLPYRVVNIAAGALGAAAATKHDVEVWLPSEGRYRELMSCSNYRDFSARRLQTRVVGPDGARLVHTLNGTGCAVGRTLVFLWEHCQRPDGSLEVPAVLQPWCGFETVPARSEAG